MLWPASAGKGLGGLSPRKAGACGRERAWRSGPVSRVLSFPSAGANGNGRPFLLGSGFPPPPAADPGVGTGRDTQCRPHNRTPPCLALLPMGFTEPSRSPGLLVSSYLTVSPLPPGLPGGGLLSVALSLASRPVGVTHHRTLWSPDFPLPAGPTAPEGNARTVTAAARSAPPHSLK
jgi:hypothetical protein